MQHTPLNGKTTGFGVRMRRVICVLALCLTFAGAMTALAAAYGSDSAEEYTAPKAAAVEVVMEYDTEATPYNTVYQISGTLPQGETRVVRSGETGEAVICSKVSYLDGKELSRVVVSKSVTKEPVCEIIDKGFAAERTLLVNDAGEVNLENTQWAAGVFIDEEEPEIAEEPEAAEDDGPSYVYGQRPETSYPTTDTAATYDDLAAAALPEVGETTITAADGTVYEYTEALSFEATAYTAYSYDGGGPITAIGTDTRVGAVAVDPRVIPLGSELYIVTDSGFTYGYCVAEDTGGAIKGSIVDVYFNSESECVLFGRQSCTVYILK